MRTAVRENLVRAVVSFEYHRTATRGLEREDPPANILEITWRVALLLASMSL